MATLSTTYDYVSGQQTTLAVNLTPTQTSGIKFAAIRRNGTTEAWTATSGIVELRQERNGELIQEWMSFDGLATNADNTVTLTAANVSRGIAINASLYTGTGTGQRFSKGVTEVRLVLSHQSINDKADVDRANTFAGIQTFSGQLTLADDIEFTGTTKQGIVVRNLTTTERDALSEADNGAIVYNTTTGVTNFREGGAWVANAAGGSVADASTTVAGKVEEATAAELGAGTAAGGTSARLFINPSLAVKTSSGAGDENKIPVLDSSGDLAAGFIPNSAKPPTGSMMIWLTNSAPTDWLLCYGQAVSRTTYADLFAVLSTVFGVGDGSTTFNLPDLRGRFPLGQDDMGGSSANRVTDTDADTLGGADGDEFVTLTAAQLPAHDHSPLSAEVYFDLGGAVTERYIGTNGSVTVNGSTMGNRLATVGNDEAHDNMPPFITVNYIIKT